MNRNRGRRKKSKICDTDQDLISNLPDFIIGHILSFLDTKYAVCTCVLSKRWKNLWKFITKLHFEDRSRDLFPIKINKTHFLNFVNRVLVHNASESIESFSLYLSLKYDSHRLNLLISDMLNRGAKHISIKSKLKKQQNISSCSLWKSRNLEELVLTCCAIRFPNSVCVSSLTVLKLFSVTLTCDSQNLNLNLPVLRKYETIDCTWLSIKRVTFEVPLLEVLFIKHYSYVLSDDSLSIIKFCVPRLTHFSYRGCMFPDTILLDLDPSTETSVASANIDFYEFKEESEKKMALFSYKLLKQFHISLKCLKFKRSQILELVRDSLIADPFKFEMLTRLKLGKVTGEILKMFLIRTPCLKTLNLEELVQFEEELWDPEFVPPCFKSKLQVVHFGKLNGDEHELRFAKYVLENAQVLERANFSTPGLPGSNFEYVKKRIFS